MEDETLDLELEIDEDTADEVVTEEKKPVESIEARKARLERQLKGINKKLGINSEDKIDAKIEKNTGELGRLEKYILKAENIVDADEVDLAKSIMKETGKDIEDVLESRYFKAELKSLREEKEANDALPKSSKRSGQSSMNNVDYWLAKGEMPPANNPDLRRQYVNAKMTREKSQSQFSSDPIN